MQPFVDAVKIVADAFLRFLPFGCSIGVLANRKSVRFFCIRTRRIRETLKH
nr:MAG TPA: hypothetical protein [Caudoviricetes sp.]